MASNRTGSTRAVHILASAGISLLAGACSQLGSTAPQLSAVAPPDNPATKVAMAKPAAPTDGRSELLKATEYWGQAYAKNPQDAQTALNYARNLKAMGEKRQALAVLQQASMTNANHKGINAEYGRLALEFDQVSLAQKLLEQGEDPTNPDWRIVSARGTVLAKQSRYREAIAYYERAMTMAPDQPSVLSNLALAHAMEGEIDKAEPLLRRAVAAGAGAQEARVNQNLALVLGLQGKYDEAKLAAARSLPADKAAANVDFVRSIVQLEAKPLATGSLPAPKDVAAKETPTKVAAVKEALAVKEVPAKPAAAAEKAEPKATVAAADDVAASSGTNWATLVATAKSKR